MQLFVNYLTKIGIIIFAALVILFSSLTPLRADMNSDISAILKLVINIDSNVNNMLQEVRQIPGAIKEVSGYIFNIVNGDTSNKLADIQNIFAQQSLALLNNTEINVDLQNQLNNNLFGSKITASQNDLIYTKLLAPNPPPAANYISNASGIRIKHLSPDSIEFKSNFAKEDYLSFYNTVMAISSFNAYVLSSMATSDGALNELQKQLLKQAGDSKWFAVIATDPIGLILRRILMYQSQQFLFFHELMKTQKQLLYAQAMTNSLMINGARSQESLLVKNSMK